MKRLFILSFFSMNLAHAFDLSSTSNTKFEILNSYFANARRTNFEEAEGWWSGRCYRKDSQQTAIGSILVVSPTTGQNQTVPGVDGPLFASVFMTPKYNMMVFEVPAASVDYVDFPDKEFMESMEVYSNSAEFKQFKATYSESSIVSKNEPGNAHLSLRKYENYLLAQAVALDNDSNSTVGDIFSNCYFFKKIK